MSKSVSKSPSPIPMVTGKVYENADGHRTVMLGTYKLGDVTYGTFIREGGPYLMADDDPDWLDWKKVGR